MIGKTCLVTGATSGIGAETALGLARLGATVVLVGRSRDRCEATAARIRASTGAASVDTIVADLSSKAEIRRAAAEFLSRHDRLDVLVNNAGALFMKRLESVDGTEMTFALNHLAYFLLTTLLLESLRAAAPSRVVNVSSCGHVMAKAGIDFDDIQRRRRPYRGFVAYHQSKLANLLFTRELARRLEGSGVTANALDPGIVETDFNKKNGWIFRALTPLYWKLTGLKPISVEEGARTPIHLASSPEVAGISGRYFVEEKVAESSEAARDDAAALRLWNLSEEWTSKPVPSHA